MDNFIKESGSMEWNMVLECGKVPKETHMLESGSLEKQMVMVCIHGLMEIVMKDNLKTVSNMVKDYKNLQMETFIRDFMFKANHQGSDNIIGQMEAILKALLRWVYVVVMVYGRKDLEIVTNTKVSILMTKNQVTEFSHGQVEMCTKEIMIMTLEMVMVKCIGWTVVFIREIGGMEFSMERGKYMCLVRELRKGFFKIIL